MALDGQAFVSNDELMQLVHGVEPSAFLVLPRILRRVIKEDRRVAGFGLHVPHRKSYWLTKERFAEVADADELGPEPDGVLPDVMILLPFPASDSAEVPDRDALLLKYWRLLFHAKIHVKLEETFARRKLTRAAFRERVHRIGQTEFDEVRSVLRVEDFLLPPRDARHVYAEFAAVYLELRYFAPGNVTRYFPAIQRYNSIDSILDDDVDAEAVFEETRLPGAPHPSEHLAQSVSQSEHDQTKVPIVTCNERQYPVLMNRAERSRTAGNVVRSAILRKRAATLDDAILSKSARDGARADLRRLVSRLQTAIGLNDEQADDFYEASLSLLKQTVRGRWTVEARLLYDLQKVCVDYEREISKVDVIQWVLSFGKRPIKRDLPSQREVLMTRHLGSALDRLAVARISESDRDVLATVLTDAAKEVDDRMRTSFRPRLLKAIDDVDLTPNNVPERVARDKLVEELLDRVAQRGFLSIGDVRDALSRNNLKLPDLQGPGQLLRGDQLLKIDYALSYSLDGVYRRGEIYLRWLQRLSACAFGTILGRYVTKFVALPFGGTYVILEGLQHLIAPLVHWMTHLHVEIMNPITWTVCGLFAFGVINSRPFRNSIAVKCHTVWRALKTVLVEAPRKILALPLVRRIVESRYFLLSSRLIFKPLIVTLLVWSLSVTGAAPSAQRVWLAGLLFFCFSVFLNSRFGRYLEEIVWDWLGRTWRWIRFGIISGLFRLIVDVFSRALETTERMLYSVDEWLRFRSGQSTLSTILKPILSTIWFFVDYVLRFCINLLIEPQINPIKHFPVVTVSHKIILPMTPQLITILTPVMGKVYASTVAPTIIFSVPGVFGFLVWELKENWKLYAASRPKDLKPVAMGHHGETMVRLMKPGIHSGTLPKLYSKLRRTERKPHKSKLNQAARKHRLALHHVEEALHRVVEREMVRLLEQSQCWSGRELEVGHVVASSNRIQIPLKCPKSAAGDAVIVFEEQSGRLLASVAESGWLRELATPERIAFRNALAGLYKISGVDFVREQIDEIFGDWRNAYDVSEDELVLWPGEDYQAEVLYNLREIPVMTPVCNDGSCPVNLPILQPEEVMFQNANLSWETWVAAWDQDQQGDCLDNNAIPSLRLLPPDCDHLSDA